MEYADAKPLPLDQNAGKPYPTPSEWPAEDAAGKKNSVLRGVNLRMTDDQLAVARALAESRHQSINGMVLSLIEHEAQRIAAHNRMADQVQPGAGYVPGPKYDGVTVTDQAMKEAGRGGCKRIVG